MTHGTHLSPKPDLVRLRGTVLRVSKIGLGTWALGGTEWGPTDDAESVRVLHEALDRGVNFLDTADEYGRGHAEELIGQVLAERSDRDSIVVATKVGMDFYNAPPGMLSVSNFERDYILSCVDKSLRRLGRGVIDLYQLHNPSSEEIERGEVFETMELLQQQGKIRYYGISVNQARDGVMAIQESNVSTVQIGYSILAQEPAQLLFPLTQEKDVGIIARRALHGGLLTGKFTRETVFPKDDHRSRAFSPERLERLLPKVEAIAWLKDTYGSLGTAALRFIMDHPAVDVVIPGARTVDQVRQNMMVVLAPPISADDRTRLEALYRNDFATV